MSSDIRLEMRSISKYFAGVTALNNVDFSLRYGEIHALVGENGAGKSTLMKILSGAHKQDEGEIFINGKLANINSPRDAMDMGIGVIYQEFTLAPDLTVVENIYLDQLSKGTLLINWKKLEKEAKEQLTKLGFEDIDPRAKVSTLSVAYQQIVEICKCLTKETSILVLDEPTAVLTFSEIEKLFELITSLRDRGVSIVYISHRLEEIFSITDRISVLKDGENVDTVNTKDITNEKLVTMMVGRELNQLFPKRNATIGKPVLEVSSISSDNIVKDVSFTVNEGEVLGFSGLVGAGRSETMRAIFGADKITGGTMKFLGKETVFASTKEARQAGLGMLPEDRKKHGLLINLSIRINTTLAALNKITKAGFIKKKIEKQKVDELLETLRTRYSSAENAIYSLSGGNQQKVAVAKWVFADCSCIIFDEPTRGVDVGAKTEIYRIINELAEKGIAIIVVSSEMPEVIGLCDRAVVLRQGRVAGTLEKDQLTENNLIRYAMGVE